MRHRKAGHSIVPSMSQENGPAHSQAHAPAEAQPTRAATDKFKLPGWMRYAEQEAINSRRRAQGETTTAAQEPRVGLALSGGGIRSATFCLGVLQTLAKEGILKHVDYLSTVSGGGYIGGSLTWLLRNCDQFDTGDNFPFRANKGSIVAHLRAHGNYLTPGRGITWESLFGAVLRGLVLNVIVWLPLAVALLYCLLWLAREIGGTATGVSLLMCIAALIGVAFFLMSVWYSWRTRISCARNTYRFRRFFDESVPWLLRAAVGLLALGSLPLAHQVVKYWGLLVVLAGAAGGFWWFWKSTKGTRLGRVGILAPVASAVILYGLALTSYALAYHCLEAKSAWPIAVAVVLVVLWALTSWCVNLNYISIHRYYRDRLMEAFMSTPGETRRKRQNARTQPYSSACATRTRRTS